MKVVIEKRPIVGTLKTLVGTYQLLDDRMHKYGETFRFNVVDDEQFDNYLQIHGDFVVIPAQIMAMVDVKRALGIQEEAEHVEELAELEKEFVE